MVIFQTYQVSKCEILKKHVGLNLVFDHIVFCPSIFLTFNLRRFLSIKTEGGIEAIKHEACWL
jgi:hypothetical protein